MFNCPQWGIGVEMIETYGTDDTTGDSIPIAHKFINSTTLSSCDSLVRVCILAITTHYPISLRFSLAHDAMWVHLAEVTFYEGGRCAPDKILNYSTPSPQETTPPLQSTSVAIFPAVTSLEFPPSLSSLSPPISPSATTTRGMHLRNTMLHEDHMTRPDLFFQVLTTLPLPFWAQSFPSQSLLHLPSPFL